MFHIFFLENFIDGIIPPKTRQNVIYKGGYGRGEGVPTPYRGVLTIILGGVGGTTVNIRLVPVLQDTEVRR